MSAFLLIKIMKSTYLNVICLQSRDSEENLMIDISPDQRENFDEIYIKKNVSSENNILCKFCLTCIYVMYSEKTSRENKSIKFPYQ